MHNSTDCNNQMSEKVNKLSLMTRYTKLYLNQQKLVVLYKKDEYGVIQIKL